MDCSIDLFWLAPDNCAVSPFNSFELSESRRKSTISLTSHNILPHRSNSLQVSGTGSCSLIHSHFSKSLVWWGGQGNPEGWLHEEDEHPFCHFSGRVSRPTMAPEWTSGREAGWRAGWSPPRVGREEEVWGRSPGEDSASSGSLLREKVMTETAQLAPGGWYPGGERQRTCLPSGPFAFKDSISYWLCRATSHHRDFQPQFGTLSPNSLQPLALLLLLIPFVCLLTLCCTQKLAFSVLHVCAVSVSLSILSSYL